MKIHVQLAGVKLGPYSEKQVRDYLSDGLLSLSDPARLEGSEEWKPVEEVLASLPKDEVATSPVEPAETTVKPDAVPETSLPQAVTTEEAKVEAMDEPKLASPATPLAEPVPKIEPAPLSMPLVVKSLLKKSSPPGKPTPGLLSLTPSMKAAESPTSAFSSPLKVLTKKAEPEAKPKIKPIRTIPSPTSSASVDKESNLETPAPLLPGPILVIGKKPEPGVKVTPSPAEPSPVPTPATTEKPAEKIIPIPVEEPLSLTQFIRQSTSQETVPSLPLAAKEPDRVVAKPEEATVPMAKAPSAEQPAVSASTGPTRRYLFWAVSVPIFVLVLLFLFYIGSSYHGAGALRSAINSGDQTQLESTIDFPALRDSLKQQFHDQLAKSGVNAATGNSSAGVTAVSSMIDRSIDYYVTPAGLSGLMNNPHGVAPDNRTLAILPEVAAKILSAFNALDVKTERLASVDDFVLDLETVRLHLQFYGMGWKLNHIELLTDWQLPAPSETAPKSPPPTPAPEPAPVTPAPATPPAQSISPPSVPAVPPPALPTTDTSSALTRPVIATYLDESQAKYQKGDWDGAIAAASQALAIDAKNSVAYFNRGAAREAKGDLEGSLADFSSVIQQDPKLAAAYFERGKIRALKKDNAGALEDFTQSVTLEPNQAPVYSNRGYVREAQNDLPGAMADYTQALALNPKMAGTYFNRGRARQAQGDLDGSIGDFNQAISLDPKMARAYYNRGNVKSAKRDWDGAIADFNQNLTLDPANAMAYCQRGVAREAKNDLPGATADFTQSLAIDSKIGSAYYYRGLLRERNDDLDGAIADNTRAIELDPNNAQAYYNRGFARLSKGILDGANDDLQKFCQLAPHDAYADHARLYLWMIAKAQKRQDDADHALTDALQNHWNSTSDDFTSKLAAYLLGRMSEDEVISAAISPDPNKDQSQHCEVWYFAGMQRLLSGDRDKALDYFQRCVDTGQKEFCEYILAKSELKVLASDAKAPVGNP